MMNQRNSFLTRFLALALAVVLAASGFGPAVATRVSADEISGDYVTVGDLVVDNYDLTDAEKTLMVSGYLSDATVPYTALKGEGLVEVDTKTAKITANESLGWTPVDAVLVAPNGATQTVKFENGVAKYDPAIGFAFSVDVCYKLNAKVDRELQNAVLSAPAALKQGIAHMETAKAADVNLAVVAEAMDTLVMLADGIKMGPVTILQLQDEAAEAVRFLAAQKEANYGVLDLQMQNAVYEASAAKTENLVKNGAAYNTAAVETYNALKAIASDRLATAVTVDNYLEKNDPANYKLWMALKDILAKTVETLAPAACEWNIPTLAKNVDYVELDALLAAVETVSTVEVKDILTLASDYVTVSQGVKNVEFKVVLMATGADNKVVELTTTSVVLSLRDNASKAEIEAAIAAQGEGDITKDEAYKAEHFTRTTTELPEVLTEDISYVVTYAPKNYTVSYGYAEAEQLPYGAVITLPVSEDVEKAYDYTVNGELFAEGSKVMVNGDMTITRTIGKAYFDTDLYTVIADNFGNDVAKAVLKSGALTGNQEISVRKPEAEDAAELLYLADGVLTAKPGYVADYKDLKWAPYGYGAEKVTGLFGDATTAPWTEPDAKVQFALTLTNFSAAEVKAVLELAKALKDDANAQTEALARLVNYYTDMGALNKIMLGGLLGSISVTDFYPENLAKTVEMRNYFTALIQDILANNMDGNNLRIYKMLTSYQNVNDGGLRYYYNNAAAVIAEVKDLSVSLTGLAGDADKEYCLGMLLEAFGYGHYVEKIAKLGKTMEEVGEALTLPNAAIDLESDNLGNLLDALSAEGTVVVPESVTSPKLLSDMLAVTDVTRKLVSVKVSVNNESETFATPSIGYGEVVTAEMVAALKAQIAGFVNEKLGAKLPFYTLNVEGGELDALVGKTLDANTYLNYSYAPTKYTVNVEGTEAQTITVENRWVKLPRHAEDPDYINVYTVKGEETESSVYQFTVEDLANLFADGAYTITCYEIDQINRVVTSMINQILSMDSINDWSETVIKDGAIESITVNVAAGSAGMAAFASDLTTIISGEYAADTIFLDGKRLLYIDEATNITKFSVQTLMDAILADENFSNETLIELGQNGKGTVFTTNLTLGYTRDVETMEEARAAKTEVVQSKKEIPFTLNLMGVPAQMATVSKVLSASDNFLTFSGKEGFLDLKVNLPDEIYYAYLSTMVDYGTLDKTNLNAINNEVAFQFLFDLYEAVMNPEIDTTTFQNTLDMFDTILRDKLPEADLTQYEAAYQKALNFFRGDSVEVTKNEENTTLAMTVKGEQVKAFLRLVGMDVDNNALLPMIKEMGDGEQLNLTVRGTLANANEDFEAVVIDVRGPGLQNKFEMTTDLVNFDLHGVAAITLVDDVYGDLTFDAITLIDLNGHTIHGNVTANSKVIILDSVIDNALNCGGIDGNLSGNFTIMAGKYTDNVSKYLRDGYVQNEAGAVHNAMYEISVDNGVVTFEVNSNFTADYDGILPDVYTLVANIVTDVLANYHTSAALTFNGKTVYDFTVNDIIGLLASDATPTAIINTGLNFVQNGVEEMINCLLAELLDFGGNKAALVNGDVIASFDVQSARWTFDINYVEEGNYLSGGMAANYAVTDEYTINIKFTPTNETAAMAGVADYLDGIVVDETYSVVDIFKPVYANGTLSMGASYDTLISLDLSDEAHITMITMALAYGNPEKAADLISALSVGATVDGRSLKQVIDAMTLADVCDSLTAFVNAGSYAAVASKVPVPVPVPAKVMEKLYDVFALVATKALDLFADFRGDVTIGNFDRDNNGIYAWDPAAKEIDGAKHEGLTGRGYGVDVDYSADLMVKVNLFCRLGDVNHDGKVNSKDAALVLQYTVEGEITDRFFCKKGAEVSGTAPINAKDAAYILEYTVGNIDKFPAQK